MSANKYKSFRLSPTHEIKIQRLADELGISSSAVLRRLIENAEVESRPVLSVGLHKNNRQAAQDYQVTSSMAIGA